MGVVLPVEIYEIFERVFGKEDAKAIVKSLEMAISSEVSNTWYKTSVKYHQKVIWKL